VSASPGNAERRATTYRLFAQALDLPLAERSQFLDEQCGHDLDLRAEVEALLTIVRDDGMQTGALVGGSGPAEESLAGRIFGRFRLREPIGAGGMGVVYLADRTDGVQQLVAVKLVSSLLASSAQRNFEREVQILARLEHPSVARLIDAGVDEGRAWVAIEYVRGLRIDEYCTTRELAIPGIVKLLVQLSAAVSAAHAMLVVHSDIKPANVLVTAEGLPKLIDFGIATALRDSDTERAPTIDVRRLFSPNYSAPEQVTGGAVTVATDVFGLGALAYRLLTGVPIYRDAKTPVAYLMAVSSEDVERPSRAAIGGHHDRSWSNALRGDLDAILCKALERDPERRYASAADFRVDLQRYLDGRPVTAHAPSAGYRTGKFIRRNALAVLLSSLLVASLVAGGVFAWVQSGKTAVALKMAARRGEFLESVLKSANPLGGGSRDVTVAQLLDASAAKTDAMAETEPLTAASMLSLVAETNLGLDRNPQGLAANTRAIELLRASGGSAAELASALTTRGQLLIKSGRYRESEAPLVEAVALAEHSRGAEKQLGAALNALGAAYQDSERETQADAMYQRSIQVYRSAHLETSEAAADPIANLGVLRYNEGRYNEAADYMREAVEMRRQSLPPDHPELLGSEYNYAACLQRNHQAPAAERIFRDLLATYTRILGPDHEDTLMTRQGLAANLLRQKRYAEAAAEALPAAQGMTRAEGDSHDWTQTAWETYGTAACLAGQGDPGLAALRRVAAFRRTGADANNWRTQLTDVHIGECLVTLKRYTEAEPLLLKAVAALEATRGAKHDNTQTGYRALRDLYAATGRSAEAARVAANIQP
jgi:tetratricopeptide (TPR) repeat protein